MKLFVIVSGYIRTKEGVLMVANNWRPESPVLWSLPGGTWEKGKETLIEALIRECKEESGVKINKVGNLLYVVEAISQLKQEHFISMTFEILDADISGLIIPKNDEYIVDVKWVLNDKISELCMQPSMQEPLVKHINGESERFYQYLDI